MRRLGVALIAGVLLVPGSSLRAQDATDTVVRGENVWLRAEPAAETDAIAYLQRGDAITITGDAETESGETKVVNAGTIGVTRTWYVPVEVTETGAAGWVAELFVVRPIAVSPPEPTPEPPRRSPRNDQDAGNPTGANDAADLEYLAATGPLIDGFGQSLQRFALLAVDPRFGNPDWMVEAAVEIVIWDTTHDALKAIEPPPGPLTQIHGKVVEAVRIYARSGQKIARGIDNLDAAQIEDAVSDTEEANTLFEDATALLEEYNRNGGN